MSELAPGQEQEQTYRDAGFSEDEISEWKTNAVKDYRDAGFSDDEIGKHFGVVANPDMSATKQFIKDNLAEYNKTLAALPEQQGKNQAQDFEDAFKAGWQLSIPGIVATKNKQTIDNPEDANWAMRLAKNIGTIAGDLPTYAMGGELGAAAGASVGAPLGAGGGPIGAAIGAGVGAGVGGGAGAFALHAALRKALVDHYDKGDIKDPSDFLQRAMAATWEGIKGGTTGAAMAVAGPLGYEGAGVMGQLTSELATMTTVGKALEGQMPSWQDFQDGALLIGALHTVHVVPKLYDIYAKTGITPQQVVEAADKDPVLKQNLLSENIPAVQGEPGGHLENPNIEQEIKDAQAKNEAQPNRTEAEKKILSNVVEHPDNKSPWKIDLTSDRSTFSKEKTDPFSTLTTALGDDLDATKRVLEATGNTDLPADKDPYVLQRNFRDWAGKLYRTLKFNTIDYSTGKANGEGLLPILKDVPDQDFNGLNAYLISGRVTELEERNQQLEAKGKKRLEHGFDVDAAKQVLQDGHAKYQAIAQRLVDYQNRVKQYAVDAGLLDPKKSRLFDEMGKAFIPLHRLMDVDPLTGKRGTGGLFKRLKGSDREVLNPLQTIFKNSASIMQAAEKNRANLALVDLPNADEFIKQVPAKNRPITITAEEMNKEHVSQGLDSTDAEARAMSVWRPDSAPLNDNEIPVMRGGKREVWALHQDLAEAVKAMSPLPQFTSTWAKLFAAPFKIAAKALRFGIITDPAFALGHMQRVVQLEAIQSKYPHIPFAGVIPALTNIFKEGADFQEFVSSGGMSGSLERVQKLMDQKPWENTQDLVLNKVFNKVTSGIDLLHHMVAIGDAAPRLAEFKRAGGIDGDLATKTQAAFDARNLTLDYSRRGAFIAKISPFIPFLNVDVQGTYRTIENAVSENKGRIFAIGSATITLPTIANFLLNHNDPRYKNAPDWMKFNYWVIPTDKWEKPSSMADVTSRFQIGPDGKGQSDGYLTRQLQDGSWEVNNGTTLRLKKPFTMGALFGSVPEMVLNSFVDHNPRAMQYIVPGLAKSLVPFGLPTGAAPIAEQATNHSFFRDAPIVSSASEKLLAPYQYTHYTSETAKQVGKIIGSLPSIFNFGPKDAKLASPEVVDNYLRAWGGTGGQWAIKLLDAGLHAAGIGDTQPKPSASLSDIPMVSEFISRFPSTKAQSIEDFRDRFNQNEIYYNTVKMLAKKGDPEAAQKLAAAGPQYMLRLNVFHDGIVKMNQAMNLVNENKNMSPTDKRQLIDTMTYQMMSTATQGLKLIDAFDKAKAQ